MKKSDLKTGMRVRMRNGQIYLVIKDVQHVDEHQELAFINNSGFLRGNYYNDELNTFGCSNNFDVMEVYTINEKLNSLLNAYTFDLNKRYSIWKRQEYTGEQKEIFKALKVLGFNYVARDGDGAINTYQKKPYKVPEWESWNADFSVSFELTNGNEKAFDFICWSDKEPFEIPEL